MEEVSAGLDEDGLMTVELFHWAVRPFYEPPGEYHNFDEHVQETYDEAMRLCSAAEDDGFEPNRLVVALAILGHDAGYNHDLYPEVDINEWGSKEAYHAHITRHLLQAMAVPEEIIQTVERCILATAAEAACQTIEEEIVLMADVSNVPSAYENHVLKSCEFFKETVLRGADCDLARFKQISAVVLGKYFSRIKILRNIDRDLSGRNFLERAADHMSSFANETPQTILKILGNQAVRFADVLARKPASTATDQS